MTKSELDRRLRLLSAKEALITLLRNERDDLKRELRLERLRNIERYAKRDFINFPSLLE